MITKLFPDGGMLSVDFSGRGDDSGVFAATVNEGVDRTLSVLVATYDGAISCVRNVVQEGRREEFTDNDFLLADSGTFNVIKAGYEL